MNVVLKRATANKKLTGGKRRTDVWVMNPADTYDTCPTTCAHLPRSVFDAALDAGEPVHDDPTHACYANGRVAHFAVRGGETYTLDAAVSVVISDAPSGALLRWAEVGDIMLGDPRSVVDSLARLRTARPDITVIAYTHAWRTLGGYGADIFRASCESPTDITFARALGYRPAMTVPEDWTPADMVAYGRDAGMRGFVCPAALRPDVQSCVTCGACDTSEAAVAFPAHGMRKGHAGKGML